MAMKNATSRAAALCAVTIGILCAAPFLMASAASVIASPPVPTEHTEIDTGQVFTVVDFPPTPPTLPELVKAVDVVVLARVDATSPAQADRSGPSPKVRRIQDLTILEVLNGGDVPSAVEIQRRLG
jgi:hypothetical protein